MRLVVNVETDTVTAVLRAPKGMRAEVGDTREPLEAAVREAMEVARAKSIELSCPGQVFVAAEVTQGATRKQISSLGQARRERRHPRDQRCNRAGSGIAGDSRALQ